MTALLLTLFSSHAVAEMNDDAFNQCLHTLQRSQFKLIIEPWHSFGLPNNIEKIEQMNLYGDLLVRWTDHKNQNGSITYVILTRDADPVHLHNYRSYIGRPIDGIAITEAGLLAGAHLVGYHDVEKFLTSNGRDIKKAANQIPITEYLKNFSNYNFTFPSVSSGFSPAVDTHSQTTPTDPAPSDAKTLEPAPSKPALGHAATNLNLFDLYDQLYADGKEPAGGYAEDWGAMAADNAAQLYDPLIPSKERMSQIDFAADMEIVAALEASHRPGLPPYSITSGNAGQIDRGGDKPIDLQRKFDLWRSSRHVPSGRRDDPIFIYTDTRPGGTP